MSQNFILFITSFPRYINLVAPLPFQIIVGQSGGGVDSVVGLLLTKGSNKYGNYEILCDTIYIIYYSVNFYLGLSEIYRFF